MQIFLGFKEGKRPEIVQCEKQPSKKSHPQFEFFYGPFKSVDEASKYVKAMTGLACGEG
jgi:hypothetical protein